MEDNELLGEINSFLHDKRLQEEIVQRDMQVADVVTPDEYFEFSRYKNFLIRELGKANRTPGESGALISAIEQGFALGYWYGMQKRTNIERNG
jgi:hydrogenase maturation factor